MLQYLKENSNENTYPIMGFDYAFESLALNTDKKNENGIIFPDNFKTTNEYTMSQCLMAKAVYDAKNITHFSNGSKTI